MTISARVAKAVVVVLGLLACPPSAICRADEAAEHQKLAEDLLVMLGSDEAGFTKMVEGVRAASKPVAGSQKQYGKRIDIAWSDARQRHAKAVADVMPPEALRAFAAFSQTPSGGRFVKEFPEVHKRAIIGPMARAYGVDPAAMAALASVKKPPKAADADRRDLVEKLFRKFAVAGAGERARNSFQLELRKATASSVVTTPYAVGSPALAQKMIADEQKELEKRLLLLDAALQADEYLQSLREDVAASFTAEDLSQIIAFVDTPGGAAFVSRFFDAMSADSLESSADLLLVTGIHEKDVAEYRRLALQGGPAVKAAAADQNAVAIEGLRGKALDIANAGQREEAIALYEQALDLALNHYGQDHVETARVLGDLAFQHWMLGRFAKAESLRLRQLEILEKAAGKDALEVADCLDALGLLYLSSGQAGRGVPLLERALAIREKQFGSDSIRLTATLDSLQGLYATVGQRDREEKVVLRSLAIQEKHLGPEHPDLPPTLERVADYYQSRGQLDKAEAMLQRGLAIREKLATSDENDFSRKQLAWSLKKLADFYRDTGRPEKARPLEERRLSILDKAGEERDVAYSKGMSHYQAGEYAAALPHLERVLELDRKQWGDASTNVASDHMWVGETLRHLRRSREAATHFDAWRRVERRQAGDVLPMLTEKEQLEHVQRDRSWLDDALSLTLAAPDDTEIAELSAGWLLNSKAIVLDSLAARALVVRAGTDEAAAALAADLVAVRKELSGLVYQGTAAPADADRSKRIERLTVREQELSRSLGVVSVWSRQADPWIAVADVRKGLPAGAIMVEIARVDVSRIGDDGQETSSDYRYVAWVIPKDTAAPVRAIDLGDAWEIDREVQAIRDEIGKAPERFRAVGEADAEAALKKKLRGLAEKILDPILDRAGSATKILLAPDGDLWLVPWAALPQADGRYAIETFDIRYLTTGRDLVAAAVGPRGTSAAVVLADPDFDLAPAAARDRAAKLAVAAASPAAGLRSANGDDRGLSPPLALPRVPRLPYTAAEARFIAPGLAKYSGGEPKVFLDTDALEGVFKSLVGPRVVVLSTHGYFQPAPQPDQGRPVAQAAATNPLLRCGILLAGCNARGSGTAPAAKSGSAGGAVDEDGILTGLEIVGTDLRGTELVVLSACQTAEGQVNVGEGVAGLRQAFQLAGARCVAATLWQVPDRQTAELMKAFFDELAARDDAAEALRAAQLAMITARRGSTAAAHPLFWAGFTLTGKASAR